MGLFGISLLGLGILVGIFTLGAMSAQIWIVAVCPLALALIWINGFAASRIRIRISVDGGGSTYK